MRLIPFACAPVALIATMFVAGPLAAQTAQPPAQSPAPQPATALADPPGTTPGTTVATRNDATMRMTVPVTLNGHGPYHFIIDTGADRTVVSRALAEMLNLADNGSVTVHSLSGANAVPTVALPSLEFGGQATRNINAPALDSVNIGAPGLLGLDSLKGRRVVIDFRSRTMFVAPVGSRDEVTSDTIVVTAKSRFGQLLMVDADIDGRPITVIVDSGAEFTIANPALLAMLQRQNPHMLLIDSMLSDVVGRQLPARIGIVPKMRLGGLNMERVTMAFADAHPFKQYGLENRPAMLLGISTLRAFQRVSVDFAARKVRFMLPPVSDRDTRVLYGSLLVPRS